MGTTTSATPTADPEAPIATCNGKGGILAGLYQSQCSGQDPSLTCWGGKRYKNTFCALCNGASPLDILNMACDAGEVGWSRMCGCGYGISHTHASGCRPCTCMCVSHTDVALACTHACCMSARNYCEGW